MTSCLLDRSMLLCSSSSRNPRTKAKSSNKSRSPRKIPSLRTKLCLNRRSMERSTLLKIKTKAQRPISRRWRSSSPRTDLRALRKAKIRFSTRLCTSLRALQIWPVKTRIPTLSRNQIVTRSKGLSLRQRWNWERIQTQRDKAISTSRIPSNRCLKSASTGLWMPTTWCLKVTFLFEIGLQISWTRPIEI